MNTAYADFLARKAQIGGDHGFDPAWVPEFLFDYQRHLVEWACRKGRAAIFADCGMGKTAMQLVWAANVREITGLPVLILTPLAVSYQTVKEAERFGIDAEKSNGGTPTSGIVVTNYEKLHHFRPEQFGGVVCDESSILKAYDGSTRRQITDFMRSVNYRLLCTATAAPNDYVELGTSAEALGVMERKHMLAQFFTHDGGDTASWRLKGHAKTNLFWRWVCSWARACRRPSDLGFSDGQLSLPDLLVREHVVKASAPRDGFLFELPAVGLAEQRDDLKRTLQERCEMVAGLATQSLNPMVAWTNLNAEADLITSMIGDAVNVQGSDSDERKEWAFKAFSDGDVRVIVSKPTIAGFGLNWQHCAHMTFFPSHSYEQYYQCVRRCWRFGQKRDVTVDMVATEGQQNVMRNLERKADAAAAMFEQMVSLMRSEITIERANDYTNQEVVPGWL